LEGNPYLNEVIIYDKDKKHKSLWASIKFSFYLRKNKFDLAIILHPTNRVHLLTFFAGIPRRIGWNKKMGWLLTNALIHKKQEGKKHELDYTLDILREMGIPIVDKNIYFPIKNESERKIEMLLEERGVKKGEQFVIIHPSASCPSKRWPIEHFLQLVKLLKENTNLKIIVITSAEERVFGEQIVKESNVIDLRGELGISEVGSLVKRAALFISNDSGPVHIAAALNIPVISIFGRSDSGLSPQRWRPLGENSFYIHKDVGCIKCLAHNCTKGFLCLKEIKPQELLKKALILLNRPS
jgi:heptosyltransferase-2